MKFPVIEPLRRNGKKILPPNPAELDPDQDGEEIDRLVARGVIEDVRDKPAKDPVSTDGGAGSETSSEGAQSTDGGDSKDVPTASDASGTPADTRAKDSPKKTPVRKTAPKKKPASKPATAAKG